MDNALKIKPGKGGIWYLDMGAVSGFLMKEDKGWRIRLSDTDLADDDVWYLEFDAALMALWEGVSNA